MFYGVFLGFIFPVILFLSWIVILKSKQEEVTMDILRRDDNESDN